MRRSQRAEMEFDVLARCDWPGPNSDYPTVPTRYNYPEDLSPHKQHFADKERAERVPIRRIVIQ
jgi:hypothetical protein